MVGPAVTMWLGDCLSALVHIIALVTSLVIATSSHHHLHATRLQVVHGLPMQVRIHFACAKQALEECIMQIGLPICEYASGRAHHPHCTAPYLRTGQHV